MIKASAVRGGPICDDVARLLANVTARSRRMMRRELLTDFLQPILDDGPARDVFMV
jgi:hypothetical protein